MKATLRSKCLVTAAVVAVIATVLSNTAALANHNGLGGVVGGFQVDGNFEFPAPAALGGTRDWASVSTTRIDDKGGDPTDEVFTDGSKENEPDTWKYTTANLTSYPTKTDITRGYFASEVTPSNAHLWLGFERFAADAQGNASMNFELNQKASKIVNSKGTLIPERTNGDLLVLYDYAGGENAVKIEVREWMGTALLGTWQLLTPPQSAAFGDINTGTVNRPAGVFGGGSAPKFRFGEAGLDMGIDVFQKFLKCPGISSFYIKSRSSGQSFNSSLRDTSDPGTIDFSTCGSITVLKDDDSGADLNGATFELSQANDPLFLSPVKTCVTGEEGTAGRCTFEDIAPGTYFVKETAAPEGYVVDPFVSTVTVARRENVVVPHAYVDPKIQYRLALTPVEDTNLSGTDHEFTAHLEKSFDSGGSWNDASGEGISFALSGNGTILAITPSGSIASDGKSGSCITGSDGQCKVTINSADPGDSTLSASFAKSTATTPIDLDQNAIKHWANYRVLIGNSGKTNLQGTSHTFPVTLQRTSDGTNWPGVAGESVDVSITSGPGSISSSTCGSTDSSGGCTVTITSNSPGDTTIKASYLATEGNTSGTFTEGASKHWVDYRTTVVDDDTNLRGEPHTFTVKVEVDNQDGFGPLQGASVNLQWDGPAGSGITGGTCTGGGATGADGTCTVTVNSTATGSGTLTANYTANLDSGSHLFSESATKTWLDFTLSVDPDSALNDVKKPHIFTVTLKQDSGSGPVGLGGESVSLALSQNATDATITNIVTGTIDSGLSGTCTTDTNGQCFVTINANTAGSATLTASWNKAIGSNSTASESDSGSKTYLDATLTKSACPEGMATPGQEVNYSLHYTTSGAAFTNASLVDELPAEVQFLSATGGGSYNAGTHDVTWNFGSLPAGTDATVSAKVRILNSIPGDPGTLVVNNATFDADVIDPRLSSSTALVTTLGASASGRAFGINFQSPNVFLPVPPTVNPDINATPDTDTNNPGQLAEVDIPGVAHADLLNVVNTPSSTNTSRSDTAISTSSNVSITLPGVDISARSLVAVSSSSATGFDAISGSAGSIIQDLVVNGTKYADISDRKTIVVGDPDDPIARIRLLERLQSGAAAGGTQPFSGFFETGLEVNAIHIVVFDEPLTTLVDESSEVIVGSARSAARFPSALACGESSPHVAGDALILQTTNYPADTLVRAGLLMLGSNGGNETSEVADTTPLGIVTGRTHTEGALLPLGASSSAEVNSLNLLSGGITADSVRASSVEAGGAPPTGDTLIENLNVLGTPVCTAAVDATATCEPEKNTVVVLDSGNVIVVLNEQVIGAGGLRVNAIHIYIVGANNPLGLPAGAEVIISSAYAAVL